MGIFGNGIQCNRPDIVILTDGGQKIGQIDILKLSVALDDRHLFFVLDGQFGKGIRESVFQILYGIVDPFPGGGTELVFKQGHFYGLFTIVDHGPWKDQFLGYLSVVLHGDLRRGQAQAL